MKSNNIAPIRTNLLHSEKISTEWYYLLRIIAVITMTADHLGKVLYSKELISYSTEINFYVIGRLAFPIFAFLFVESFYHTKNRKKHLVRLLILAFLSEIPYDLALKLENPAKISMEVLDGQNTIFTFLLCFLMLVITDNFKNNNECWSKFFGKKKLRKVVVTIGSIMTFCITFLLAYALNTDYEWRGVLFVAMLNFARNRKHFVWGWQVLAMTMFMLTTGTQIAAYFSMPLVFLMFFLAQFSVKYDCLHLPEWLTKILKSKICIVVCRYFYPAHLTILAVVKILLTVF